MNVDFEQVGRDGMPVGWGVPENGRHFVVRQVREGCRHGGGCVEMQPGPETALRFGVLEQRFDAGILAGKQVLFSAYLKAASGAQAAMQVKVESRDGVVMAMHNNVLQAVVGKGVWEVSNLSVVVPNEAAKITLGILAFGGRVVVDSVSVPSYTAAMQVVGRGWEGPSPLNRTALNNLMGFARLFGVVRYFDPGDAAAETDWVALALRGVRTLDYATMAPSLGRRMGELFEGASPGLRIYVGEDPQLEEWLKPEGKQDLVRWRYDAPGKGSRVSEPVSSWSEADLRVVNLGRGLKARVPVALFREGGVTLPRPAVAGPRVEPTRPDSYTAQDRATRLMIVILAWNALQHFHAVPADWEDALVRGLQRAALDRGEEALVGTLEEMVGTLGVRVSFKAGEAANALELPGGYRLHWQAQK